MEITTPVEQVLATRFLIDRHIGLWVSCEYPHCATGKKRTILLRNL